MRFFLALLTAVCCNFSLATGLTINAAEIGVGKFHRYDNQVHPYGSANAWAPFILATDADTSTPKIVENPDQSITIFFSTLEELLTAMDQVASQHGQTIDNLNINAHGLPGGMWFPVDEDTKNSTQCTDWVSAATSGDQENYDQYYSPVSKAELDQITQESQSGGSFSCVTGLNEWQQTVAKVTSIKTRFAPDAQINILSCSVGLGPVGEDFANGLGALVLSATAQVKTILQLGLGDWSLPEGLSFWSYLNNQQLDHDNSIYPVDRKDREIMQQGTIRVSSQTSGTWSSSLLTNQDFLRFGAHSHSAVGQLVPGATEKSVNGVEVPASVRIIGTAFSTKLNP
jgi:hypothetical protein